MLLHGLNARCAWNVTFGGGVNLWPGPSAIPTHQPMLDRASVIEKPAAQPSPAARRRLAQEEYGAWFGEWQLLAGAINSLIEAPMPNAAGTADAAFQTSAVRTRLRICSSVNGFEMKCAPIAVRLPARAISLCKPDISTIFSFGLSANI